VQHGLASASKYQRITLHKTSDAWWVHPSNNKYQQAEGILLATVVTEFCPATDDRSSVNIPLLSFHIGTKISTSPSTTSRSIHSRNILSQQTTPQSDGQLSARIALGHSITAVERDDASSKNQQSYEHEQSWRRK
jgi:hypothetical protein